MQAFYLCNILIEEEQVNDINPPYGAGFHVMWRTTHSLTQSHSEQCPPTHARTHTHTHQYS